MNFHISGVKLHPGSFVDWELEYDVIPNSEIFLVYKPYDAGLSIGQYDWYWKDGQIERIDPETRQTDRFVRLDQ